MKILAIADVESPYFWDYYDQDKLKDIDLILSAGDLRAEYLSFLVTMGHAPVLYVHGNHDTHYKEKPPEGCICVEDRIYDYNGIRIFGLGGSMWYNGGDHQYTEREMQHRAYKRFFSLRRKNGFDILLTHAPARGINDSDNIPHRGFATFLDLIDKYQPDYFIHGHIHKCYKSDFHRTDTYKETTVINAYEYYIFDY
ncbi:MAG: metallophosphoesterase [Clostridiales bacterium]|nr:metallophosphoesterase [Clostridiales bacterium]